MITYLLPTRNRPERVERTLNALGALDAMAHESAGGADVVVVDDASDEPVRVPIRLANGIPVTLVRSDQQRGAAARNLGVQAASGPWIVMLDDDSRLVDEAVVQVIADAPDDVAAIGADIHLRAGRREDGGLPEVFVGCGAAIRREAFLAAGGYDSSFHYYAEEYDLSAKFITLGWRIMHDMRFRVMHEKVARGRDMNVILHRLVRNNGYVIQRYAPDSERDTAMRDVVQRYEQVAQRENAMPGYLRGLDELNRTVHEQVREPMSAAQWDRFTGVAHVRRTLGDGGLQSDQCIAIVDPGKNAWGVRQVLDELGCRVVDDEGEASMHIIGTLSPGPMNDAWIRRHRESVLDSFRGWVPAHGDLVLSESTPFPTSPLPR